ncbi:hypothetical protein J6590_090043 [Homalodisca vitripennis]|nr:hypothetical protein J6590_090043 [Homalodisca vitripennis]
MLCDVPKNVIGTPKSPGILFNTLAARSGGMKYFGLTNRKILRGAVLRYHKSGRSSLKHPQVAALPGSLVMGESNNEVNWDLSENQAKFVKILKQFPVILEKSMIPECKRKRSCAMLEIKKLVEVCMTEGQLWKKIQNMKARIKKKADVNRTGNKKVVLKSWEEEFLNFMEADSNPSILRMAGGMAAGVKPLTSLANEESDGDFSDEEEMEVCLLQSAKKRKIETDASTSVQTSHSKKRINLPETEETKQLSTPNLQRLVLLEQLKYFRKSQQLLDMKLKREMLKAANNVEIHKTNQNDGPNDDLSGVMLMSLFPGTE